MRIAFLFLLGDRNRHIAPVLDLVPELFEARFKSSHPHGRRAHVDGQVGAQVADRIVDTLEAGVRDGVARDAYDEQIAEPLVEDQLRGNARVGARKNDCEW